MFNLNSGYVGQSMSVRAKEAYSSGEKPLSKWTKTEIIARIHERIEDESIDDPGEELLKALPSFSLQTLKELCLSESSWHHTGKFFNETNFYDVCELPTLEIFQEREETNKEEREAKKQAKKQRYAVVTYFWNENRGSMKHPNIYDCEKTFLAIIQGETATLIAPNSYSFNNKKVRNFRILKEFEKKPRKNFKERSLLGNYKEEKRVWRRW